MPDISEAARSLHLVTQFFNEFPMSSLQKLLAAMLLGVAANVAAAASPSYVFRVMERGLLPASALQSGPTDPYYSSVAAQLALDTPSGTPPITDSKGATWSTSNVALSGSQFQVGSGSLAFSSSTSNATGPAISLPGDFTIETWVYPTVSTSWLIPLIAQWNQGINPSGYILGMGASGVAVFYFGAYSGGTPLLSGGSVPLNQWTHLAVVRQGSVFREFVNGALVQSASYASAGPNAAIPTTLGNYFSANSTIPASSVTNFTGYMQQVRITNGVARYTTSFTPSTSPDPTQ
jgi:hypothetical protein